MPELTLILFVIGIILGLIIAYFLMQKMIEARYKLQLEKWKLASEDVIKTAALDRSRAVLKGKIGEQFAAIMPEFKYSPADARFLGNPIDYLVFDGYSEDRKVNLIFIDIKKGEHAKLSKQQERIKAAVDAKRVKWETINLK